MWSLRIGGAERALYQLVLGQRRTGTEVGVLVAGGLGLYGPLLEEAGVPIEVLGLRRGFDVLATRRARAIFAQWPVVHFHVAEPLLMAAAATTRARRYYTHRAGAFEYPLRRRLRYQASGRILRNGFHGIVGNTAHAADCASRLFRIRRPEIDVIYNGIDWSLLRAKRTTQDVRIELALTPDQFILGATGNLRACKRIDLAIRALQRTRADVALVIVGKGPERLALEQLAKELGVAHRLRFTGAKENIADYLQIFDAFVLPSGPEESFGNSAVEAMGFGLPTIVMRDGGGLTEHVRHEWSGIVAEDVDDLASWIDRIATAADLRAALGARAREQTRARYTVEAMVQGYGALYARATTLSSAPLGARYRAVTEAD
jgi:glycosyltransferase involved in cell wall biosynthesis